MRKYNEELAKSRHLVTLMIAFHYQRIYGEQPIRPVFKNLLVGGAAVFHLVMREFSGIRRQSINNTVALKISDVQLAIRRLVLGLPIT